MAKKAVHSKTVAQVGYKALANNNTSYGGFTWKPNRWRSTGAKTNIRLCSRTVFHAYPSPWLVALYVNSVVSYNPAVLHVCDLAGTPARDWGAEGKIGSTHQRLRQKLPLMAYPMSAAFFRLATGMQLLREGVAVKDITLARIDDYQLYGKVRYRVGADTAINRYLFGDNASAFIDLPSTTAERSRKLKQVASLCTQLFGKYPTTNDAATAYFSKHGRSMFGGFIPIKKDN